MMNTYVYDRRLGCINGTFNESVALARVWAGMSGRTMHVRRGNGAILLTVPPPRRPEEETTNA